MTEAIIAAVAGALVVQAGPVTNAGAWQALIAISMLGVFMLGILKIAHGQRER